MLDVLHDTEWLTYSRELGQLCDALYGRPVASTRFGTIAADEPKAFRDSARRRSVYLAFGLTAERGEPIKRLWGRSDWALERRIVAPTSLRVQHLTLTLRLCEMSRRADAAGEDATQLKIFTADHARDLPHTRVTRGSFPLDDWQQVAEAELATLGPEDAERRADAAARLAGLPEPYQLFGVPDEIDGVTALVRAQERP